jgi:hypothetical protein
MLAPSPPIFIVGTPRSGTTLLATLLASHSQISCGAETHFFPYLEAHHRHLAAVLRDRAWPAKATEFVTAIAVDDHPIYTLLGLSPATIAAYLGDRRPSIQALLESLTDTHRQALGKTRWAEKTPNHILHLAPLRRLYPAAPVIRLVRDPRDVALSMAAKLPWASDRPLDNAYLIDRWDQRGEEFCQGDRLTYTLQYETLVAQPTATLQALCAFIGVPFEPAMLDTTAAARHTAPAHEPWKRQVGQGLDGSRCLAWQTQPPTPDLEAISQVCQGILQTWGYPPRPSTLRPIRAHAISERFVRSHGAAIAALLAQGQLLVPSDPRRLSAGDRVIYCDVPIQSDKLSKSCRQGLAFCLTLGRARLQGVAIEYTAFAVDATVEKPWVGRLATGLLKYLGSPTPQPELRPRWPARE